jgi:hypothetical protein
VRGLGQTRIHIVRHHDPQYRPMTLSVLIGRGRRSVDDVWTMLQLQAGAVQQEYVPLFGRVSIQHLPQLFDDLFAHLPA